MNILNIAYYTGVKYFRNIIAMCFFVIAPILFLYLMGVMTGNAAPDISQKETVGFYSSDTGDITAQFDKLLHSEKVSEMLDVTVILSLADGIDKVRSGDIDTFIYIREGFSKQIASNEMAEIKLYKAKNTSVAKTLVDSFVNSTNGMSAVVKLGGMPAAFSTSDSMTVKKVQATGNAPSTKDMASISCLLIFIFYGALLGSNSIITELNKNTFIRLRCAPVKYVEDFTGKLLGNSSVMFICTVISALAANFIFKVNLNGNILTLLLSSILFLIIINSLGILLAGLTKNIYLCGLFTFALNYFMVYPITANAFTPGEGTAFDIARFISPHYYTYQAVMGTIYQNTADVQGSIAILALMALLLCSASWLVGRRLIK